MSTPLPYRDRSKIKPDLQLDRAAGQCSLRLAKLGPIDTSAIVAKLKVVEIQLIKDIEKVCPKVQARAFSHPEYIIQRKTLNHT